MKIEWTPELSVGVTVIDQQHRHFLGIMNELYDAVEAGQSKDKISGILAQVAEYAEYHFATEEKYFKMFNFKGSEEHISEHEKMRLKVKHLISDDQKGKGTVVIETIYFLEDWLKDHLSKMDRKYVDCFHDNGLA